MRNVGIVTTWHEGGAGNVSRAYMESLHAQGHNVYIYARGGLDFPKGDKNWDLDNVTWGRRYAPPRFTGFNSQYIKTSHFVRWLEKNKIDLLIFNEEHSFKFVSKVKNLGYVVGAYIDYYKKETVDMFHVYDFLLCNTNRHYSVFKKFPNCYYFGWGTDISLYKPRDSVQSARGNVVFFHSAGQGGVNGRKGTDLLVRAFQNVSADASLIIHSQVPPEKFGDEIAALIHKDPRIVFIEKTVPAPGLYSLGDVFVYPSRLEGIGLCIPEALASGLPVITSDCAPMNEFVLSGVNGLLVKIADVKIRKDNYYWPEQVVCVDDLAEKMQMYVNDTAMLRDHVRNARADAELRLNWENNSKNIGSTIEQLVKESMRVKRHPGLSELTLWSFESLYINTTSKMRTAIKSLFGSPK